MDAQNVFFLKSLIGSSQTGRVPGGSSQSGGQIGGTYIVLDAYKLLIGIQWWRALVGLH